MYVPLVLSVAQEILLSLVSSWVGSSGEQPLRRRLACGRLSGEQARESGPWRGEAVRHSGRRALGSAAPWCHGVLWRGHGAVLVGVRGPACSTLDRTQGVRRSTQHPALLAAKQGGRLPCAPRDSPTSARSLLDLRALCYLHPREELPRCGLVSLLERSLKT